MSRVSSIAESEPGAPLLVAWRLDNKSVLVVGGCAVAAARARLAAEAGAKVLVVAPTLGAELRARVRRGEITWVNREFSPSDLDEVVLVLVAVDAPAVSAQAAAEARARRIPVNVADCPELCDFWLPAVYRDGPVQVAVSTGGESPSLARRLRDHLSRALPPGVAEAVRHFGELRRSIRRVVPGPAGSKRRMAWLARVGMETPWPTLATWAAVDISRLTDAFRSGESNQPNGPRLPVRSTHGRVALVGAGPGDPKLLTRAAIEALERADFVLADRLVTPEILALVRGELRVAEKLPGRADAAQEAILEQMVGAVRAGRFVVRLKQGDPFVFGRGGEELAALQALDIAVDVIPGVTSALSAPALAGIPVTHRGEADRIVVLTGHGADDTKPALPPFDPRATFVWLMAVGTLRELCESLVLRGWPTDWPAAVIERASQPDQRTTTATLGTLAASAESARVTAPAVIVIGKTATWAGRSLSTLEWSDPPQSTRQQSLHPSCTAA